MEGLIIWAFYAAILYDITLTSIITSLGNIYWPLWSRIKLIWFLLILHIPPLPYHTFLGYQCYISICYVCTIKISMFLSIEVNFNTQPWSPRYYKWGSWMNLLPIFFLLYFSVFVNFIISTLSWHNTVSFFSFKSFSLCTFVFKPFFLCAFCLVLQINVVNT